MTAYFIAGFRICGFEGQWQYNYSPFTLAQAGKVLKGSD